MAAEDFEYVVFTCPACGSALKFCREGRWGENPRVVCLKEVLGGYFTCMQRFSIDTVKGKTYVKTIEGKPVTSILTNKPPT
jgi:hypothetical protein